MLQEAELSGQADSENDLGGSARPQLVQAVRLSRNPRAAVNISAELRVTDDFRKGIA